MMQISSSRSERCLDCIPHFVDCGIRATVGIFKRIFFFPHSLVQTFFPAANATKFLTHSKDIVPIHREIEVYCASYPETQEKLHRLMRRVEEVREKLGIQKQVELFIDSTPGNDGSCFGCLPSLTPIAVIVNGYCLQFPEEELDFLIAHELSHARGNHALKTLALNLSFLVADFACAFFWSPWAIPAIEALSSPISSWQARDLEKEADLSAVKILGSRKGAIALIERALRTNRDRVKKRRNPGERFSLEGNNRFDIWHPPLTERLHYLQTASCGDCSPSK